MVRRGEFSAIPIAAAQALAGDGDATFAIFLPGSENERPVLYRDASSELARPDFERLAEHGVGALLVRTADLGRCERILEANLTDVLHRSELAPEERADLVYHVGTAVARDMSRPGGPAPDLDRASCVVDNVISCLLSDPLIASHMLQMAEHERTTASHMFMVSALAILLGAEVFGADARKLKALGFAGMMHDIGKLGLPPEIINKPTPLTPAEVHLIQQHPIESVRLLGDHPEATPEIRQMILQHHERVDGRGYPLGVSGHDLLTGSRILTIVDTFHAMIGWRSYRRPVSAPEANRAMRTQAGKQFDADLLYCWRDLFERCWLGGLPSPALDAACAYDEISSKHEHRPTPPPPKMFGNRPKRFSCHGNVTVACVYAGRLSDVTVAPDEFVAPVHDVSRGGVCIYSAHPMFRGEVVHVRLNDGRRDVWVRGAVAWCRQHDANVYRAGIRFEQRISEHEAHRKTSVKAIAEFESAVLGGSPGELRLSPAVSAMRSEEVAAVKQENALETLASVSAKRKVSIDEERTVLALSTSGDAKVREAATDVLMKLGSKPARAALVGLLDDPEATVRERAVIAAGTLRMGEAWSKLKRMLEDEDRAVALRAAGALGRLEDDSGLALVARTLNLDGPHTRLAAHVLGEIVGHRFAANGEGIKSARRYLSAKDLALAS